MNITNDVRYKKQKAIKFTNKWCLFLDLGCFVFTTEWKMGHISFFEGGDNIECTMVKGQAK